MRVWVLGRIVAENCFTDYFHSRNFIPAWLVLFGCVFLFISSCATKEHQVMDHGKHDTAIDKNEPSVPIASTQDPLLYSDRQHAATLTSEDGFYRVSAFSNEHPLPMQKIHTWTLHVETSEGQPLENAKITVHGIMPEHRHGFPTNPKVTEYIGNGDYKVEGIKFSMPGYWQIRFNIKETNRRDTVVFEVNL